MSNKKQTGETDFQRFYRIREGASVFVSEQLINELPQKEVNNVTIKFVQKYLPFDRFVDSIVNKYFYLSAPSAWGDPFETKYLDVLGNPQMYRIPQESVAELKDMHIFCTCMTFNDSDNEEASWKSYGDTDEVVRVSYDFDKLCEALSVESIYVGKIVYKPRNIILNPTPVFNSNTDIKDNAVLLVNNLCYKQDAYEYEKELRFCKIKRGDEFKEIKGCKALDIDLSSAIFQITLPPIKFLNDEEKKVKLLEQMKKYSLLKQICPQAKIFISNLYDSSKESMITEYDINTIEL